MDINDRLSVTAQINSHIKTIGQGGPRPKFANLSFEERLQRASAEVVSGLLVTEAANRWKLLPKVLGKFHHKGQPALVPGKQLQRERLELAASEAAFSSVSDADMAKKWQFHEKTLKREKTKIERQLIDSYEKPCPRTKLPAEVEKRLGSWCQLEEELGFIPPGRVLVQAVDALTGCKYSDYWGGSAEPWKRTFKSIYDLRGNSTRSHTCLSVRPTMGHIELFCKNFGAFNARLILASRYYYSMEQFGVDLAGNLIVGTLENKTPSSSASAASFVSLECVSGTGEALPPSIVFKEQGRDQIGPEAFPDYVKLRKHSWMASKSDWLNDTVCLRWLNQNFIPYIQDQRRRDPQAGYFVLVLSYSAADVSTSFLLECIKADILPVFLPRGSGRILNPIDVGCSYSLERLCYREHLFRSPLSASPPDTVSETKSCSKLKKQLTNLLMGYLVAREDAIVKESILLGWKEAGFHPYDNVSPVERVKWIKRPRPSPIFTGKQTELEGYDARLFASREEELFLRRQSSRTLGYESCELHENKKDARNLQSETFKTVHKTRSGSQRGLKRDLQYVREERKRMKVVEI